MKRDRIEPWEDGMRVDPAANGYDWWYFDNHFPDGSQVVVVFHTRLLINPTGPLAPFATLEYTDAAGVKFEDEVHVAPERCSFSRERCDVHVGACWVRGDLTDYELHYESERVSLGLSLHSTLPSWRPGVGGLFFGDNEEHEFRWFPSVPEGVSRGVLRIAGRPAMVLEDGNAYHDHNWGDISLANLLHHWYWCRAKIGPYSTINSWITALPQYGNDEFPVVMFCRDGRLLSGNEHFDWRFVPGDLRRDDFTGKPYHATLVFEWDDPADGASYRITYRRDHDIARTHLRDQLKPLMRLTARIVGADPTYIRFAGTASVDKLMDGAVVEHFENPAIWESMYLGRVDEGLPR